MPLIVNYLFPVLLLLGGIAFLALASWLSDFIPQWALLLTMFSVANIVIAKYLGLSHRLRLVWSFRKVSYFPIGAIVGTIPAVAVMLLAKDGFELNWSAIAFSATSVATTLAIVTWEELWFRGILLEYAALKYSKIGAALIFAVLFCALHIFNPALDFALAAPDLLLGGYALAMCYFVFDSIYASIGMHFGNNLLEGSLQQLDYGPLHSQPYIYLAFSAIISIAFTIIHSKRRTTQA